MTRRLGMPRVFSKVEWIVFNSRNRLCVYTAFTHSSRHSMRVVTIHARVSVVRHACNASFPNSPPARYVVFLFRHRIIVVWTTVKILSTVVSVFLFFVLINMFVYIFIGTYSLYKVYHLTRHTHFFDEF